MSKKKSINKQLADTVKGEKELRLADEELEVLALPVEDESDAAEYSLELVEAAECVDSKDINLFESDVLLAGSVSQNSDEMGKSFRSKELDETDLEGRGIIPTLEDEWVNTGGANSSVSWVNRYIFVGVLLIMVAGIWAFLNLDKELIVKEERERDLKKLALLAKENDEAYAQDKANIYECVKGYLEATTIVDRAKWCRKREDTLRKMTAHFNNELTFDSYHLEGILETVVTDVLQKEVTLVVANVSNFNGDVNPVDESKNLLLEKQTDGTYRVDWETAVIYQPSDWNEFVNTRSSKPHVFRVEVKERIDYGPYLYNFSDDNKYQAYRIAIRGNTDRFLIAYAKKDSEVDGVMKRVLLIQDQVKPKSKKTGSMTLKLKFPKKAQSDQCVEIIEVVSETWFAP